MVAKMQATPEIDYAIDLDQLEADTKRGPSYWKPKVGDNPIRVLPFPKLEGSGFTFYVPTVEHFSVGPDKHAVFCPEEMLQKPCCVCSDNRALRRSPDPDDQKIAKDRRAKVQYFSVIVDLLEPSKGVQIFQYGSQVMADFAVFVKDKRWGSVMSPAAGRDWTLEKRQKGKQAWEVEYSARPDPEKTAIADMTWLDAAAELISGAITFPPQAQVKVWLEGAPPEDDEEVEAAARPTARPATRTVSRPVVVEDEDEEEEDEEAELEVPVTAPATVRSRPAALRPSGKAPEGAADKLRAKIQSMNRSA